MGKNGTPRRRILPVLAAVLGTAGFCAAQDPSAGNPAAGPDRPARVHFIAFSEVEYHDPYKTLPAFAERLSKDYGMRCTLSLSKKKDQFPELQAMDDADVLVMFCRHVAKLPADQSQRLRAWCEAGKPIVASRVVRLGRSLALPL
jgi:hypothetical protein